MGIEIKLVALDFDYPITGMKKNDKKA